MSGRSYFGSPKYRAGLRARACDRFEKAKE